MTTGAEAFKWNEDHPVGTRVRWTDDDDKIRSGVIAYPAQLVHNMASTILVLISPDEGSSTLFDIDDLRVVPEINTMNEFLVGTQNGKTNIIGGASAQRMDKDQALCLAAWLVMVADYGETKRFTEILDAIRST